MRAGRLKTQSRCISRSKDRSLSAKSVILPGSVTKSMYPVSLSEQITSTGWPGASWTESPHGPTPTKTASACLLVTTSLVMPRTMTGRGAAALGRCAACRWGNRMALTSFWVMADPVRQICEIARDVRRERAPSLQDLLNARSHSQVRPTLDVDSVRAVIGSEPALIADWQRFSEDKRTSGGWAFSGDEHRGWSVWQPFPQTRPSITRHYAEASEACADTS